MDSCLEYTSFLVRLWREPAALGEQPAGDDRWLAQVEHIPSGQRRYFASLEELFVYICAQLPDAQDSQGTGDDEQGR